MPRLFIEVSEPAFQSLAECAREQRRPLKDQASWLLEQQLLGSQQRATDIDHATVVQGEADAVAAH